MDDCESNKKRVRSDDSEAKSDESKRVRVNSEESVAHASDSPLVRVDSVDSVANSAELVIGSSEARLLQDDLLNILDESESPAIQGLDSVIRSFEEQISPPAPEMRLTSVSGGSQPELGYLLEASDDELGLPPTAGSGAGEEARIVAADFGGSSDGAVLCGNNGTLLLDEIPSYDSFEFGIGAESNGGSGEFDDEYVALGGLFDGWYGCYENGADSEVSWRTESLPAM